MRAKPSKARANPTIVKAKLVMKMKPPKRPGGPRAAAPRKRTPSEVANNRRHAASTRRASPSRYRDSETVSMRPHFFAAPQGLSRLNAGRESREGPPEVHAN